MPIERIVVVTKRTVLEDLVVRFQTKDQAKFYLSQAGEDFSAIEREHNRYQQALASVRRALPLGLKQHVIERSLLPQYKFQDSDLVVTLGPDGLVVNTAKYLDRQWIVPLNPDPTTIDGILCPVPVEMFGPVLKRTIAENAEIKSVTMAQVTLADGQSLLAVNDFFVGTRSHVSARYRITFDGHSENHSSSGIIVSTGAGSTGWLRSVYTGAAAVTALMGNKRPTVPKPMPWDALELMFSVREPFPSKATGTSIVCGRITEKKPLLLASMMPGNGIIFSDGIEADYLEFNSGATATLTLANRSVQLAV